VEQKPNRAGEKSKISFRATRIRVYKGKKNMYWDTGKEPYPNYDIRENNHWRKQFSILGSLVFIATARFDIILDILIIIREKFRQLSSPRSMGRAKKEQK